MTESRQSLFGFLSQFGLFRLTRRVLSYTRWILHPIVVFVILQILWVAVVALWVVWFVDVKEEIFDIQARFPASNLKDTSVLLVLVVGCVLLGFLAAGMTILFAFGQKQTLAFRQQQSFISSVTHELRSPLTAIQLTLEPLRRPNLDVDKIDRLLLHGMADVERLRRLVDQILLSSRFDRGLVPFDVTPEIIDVQDLVHGVCEGLNRRKDGDRIVASLAGENLFHTSKMAFVLILTNLLDNALKYSDRDKQVFVKMETSKHRLHIQVTDRGIGLDRKELRRVFKIFHRSSRVVERAIPGTGLGLYIVRSAVKMLNGDVWAESLGKGHGSSFFVEIPASEER